MLPPTLLSTYRQYKRDTNYISSWLAVTAKSRGYTLESTNQSHTGDEKGAPSGRLKGKARKEAKKKEAESEAAPATSYVVPIKDFIPMANWIASLWKPAVKVPGSLSTALNKVIELRSAFNTYMKPLENKPVKDESHSYFVGILKGVRTSLEVNMPSKSSDDGSTAVSPEIERRLENTFDALKIHEPTESDLEPHVVPESASGAGVKIEYAAEQQTDEADCMLVYYLLFKDLYKIREQIRLIWANIKTRGFDTAAAALATNTAIDLARSLIDDATADLKGKDLNELCKRYHYLPRRHTGLDEGTIRYPVADFAYHNALRILEDSLRDQEPVFFFLKPPGTEGLYCPERDSSNHTYHPNIRMIWI